MNNRKSPKLGNTFLLQEWWRSQQDSHQYSAIAKVDIKRSDHHGSLSPPEFPAPLFDHHHRESTIPWTLDTCRIFFPSSFCFQLWQPTPSPSPQNCLVYSSSSPSNRYMQYVHRDYFHNKIISSFQLIYLLLLRSDQVISLDERWWKIRPSTDCNNFVLVKNYPFLFRKHSERKISYVCPVAPKEQFVCAWSIV